MTAGRWAWRLVVGVLLVAAGWPVYANTATQFVGSALGTPAGVPEPRRDCLPGTAVPIMPSPHISAVRARSMHYNSTPATSGPHFGFVVTPGVYRRPVSPQLVVHALEHGHVAVQYADGTPRHEVAELERLARRHANDVVLAPTTKIRHGVAVTAWGQLAMLDRVDRARIEEFIDAFAGLYDHGWTRTDLCPGARS